MIYQPVKPELNNLYFHFLVMKDWLNLQALFAGDTFMLTLACVDDKDIWIALDDLDVAHREIWNHQNA